MGVWSACLLDKELKVNAGKSKLMVGNSDGKMIVNSGKLPCGVCEKGVQANCSMHSMSKTLFTIGAVVYVVTCRCYLTVSGVSGVKGQSKKLN